MDTLLHTGDYGTFEGAREDQVVFGHYRKHGQWSPEVLLIIQEALGGNGGTFLDVGANIGLISIPIAERGNAQVFAFEPAPANFHLLSRNVARHNLQDRVTLFSQAAYSESINLPMRISADNFGDHQIMPQGSSEQVNVQADRLDRMLRGHVLRSPVVMKIDTQGCEVRVLRGAQQTLKQVDTLILEYWPLGVTRLGDSLVDFIPLLAEFPYAQILGQTKEEQRPLGKTEELLQGLAHLLAADDPGFFDLRLCRHR